MIDPAAPALLHPPPTEATPAEAALRLLASRRTVHRFDPSRPVPADVLDRALALAVTAPNHKRTEPWRFYVLGPATSARLVALNADLVGERGGDAEAPRRRWAEVPTFVAVTCRRSEADALREREDYAACAVALHTAALALWAQGVGSKWTSGPVTRDARFFSLVGADPAAESVVGLVMVGYATELPPPAERGLAAVRVDLP